MFIQPNLPAEGLPYDPYRSGNLFPRYRQRMSDIQAETIQVAFSEKDIDRAS